MLISAMAPLWSAVTECMEPLPSPIAAITKVPLSVSLYTLIGMTRWQQVGSYSGVCSHSFSSAASSVVPEEED